MAKRLPRRPATCWAHACSAATRPRRRRHTTQAACDQQAPRDGRTGLRDPAPPLPLARTVFAGHQAEESWSRPRIAKRADVIDGGRDRSRRAVIGPIPGAVSSRTYGPAVRRRAERGARGRPRPAPGGSRRSSERRQRSSAPPPQYRRIHPAADLGAARPRSRRRLSCRTAPAED